jgi:uncharacterized protein (DUF1810 family)
MPTDNSKDPFDLARFVEAQEGVYQAALSELAAGRKRSHWMWFIFPQIQGLGRSPTANLYAIKSPAEAKAYLDHPVLGPRLRECTNALLENAGLSASDVFGFPDDLKFCSSMTLFESVSSESGLFKTAIDRYCGGKRDDMTLTILKTIMT